MSEAELYYYKFSFIDGTQQEFASEDKSIESRLLRPNSNMFKFDNVIINLENVTKVTIETKSEREEQKRINDEKTKETFESLSALRF